ncbi:hypothetical protein D3C72_1966640 [compost metagenome]
MRMKKRLQNHIRLFDLAIDPPALWEEQCVWIGFCRALPSTPERSRLAGYASHVAHYANYLQGMRP